MGRPRTSIFKPGTRSSQDVSQARGEEPWAESSLLAVVAAIAPGRTPSRAIAVPYAFFRFIGLTHSTVDNYSIRGVTILNTMEPAASADDCRAVHAGGRHWFCAQHPIASWRRSNVSCSTSDWRGLMKKQIAFLVLAASLSLAPWLMSTGCAVTSGRETAKA